MKKSLPLALLILFSVITTGMCTTWTINNSGLTFTPDTITIVFGDEVNFSLESTHDVLEVSQETWDANGTTALESGFSLPFGGGSVSTTQLSVGTHWYVCTVHASTGMKGVIIVESATDIPESRPEDRVSFYPNPVTDILTIESNQDFLGSTFSFSDLTGKLILSGHINEESVSIDVSSFKTGIYFLQLGESRRRTFKVIKN
jgi:plastocyanin